MSFSSPFGIRVGSTSVTPSGFFIVSDTEPTTRDNGGTLQSGDVWLNSTSDAVSFYVEGTGFVNPPSNITGSQIKALYEAEADTNAFDDAAVAKLAGIADGAEVNVATDLTYTAGTRELASSTGTSTTLPLAVSGGSAGLLDGSDKAQLDSLSADLAAKADLSGGKLLASQVPDIALTVFLGSVADEPSMLVLTGQLGDWVIRTDDNKVYVITGSDPTQASDWTALAYPVGNTDLTYTAGTRELASSTGTNATLPLVVASGDAGLQSGADKAKLDGIADGADVTDLSTESIDALLDVDTSTVAPTDGQALVWDNANSKWEPGTISDAVTSVNTQTGAVSLGIEDLDDFAFATEAGLPYNTWSSDVTPAAGEWVINTNFLYLPRVDSNGVDQTANLEALDGTTSLTITQDGTDYVIPNATIAANELGSGNDRMLIQSGGSPGGIISTIAGQVAQAGMELTSSSFSLTNLPLAAGDILQYDTVSSKFKPSQPNGVASVNTLTGAVSLGIEDLDDVQYSVTTSATLYEFTYAGDSGSAATGEVRLILDPNTSPPSTDKLRLAQTDANGTSVPSFSNGSTVWLSADQVTYVDVTPASFGLSGTNYILDLDSADEDTYDTLGITIGETLYVSATDPNPQTVNPSNREVLRYDTADSKFKPGQLDIQDLGDFELNPGVFYAVWDTQGSSSPTAGEWFPNGSNVIRVNPVDANGTDWSSEMTTLGTTGTFWYSTDGSNWTETVNSGGVSNLPTWFQFGLAPFNVAGQTVFYIAFSDPANPTVPPSPLAEGDILKYDFADAKFKPANTSGIRSLLGIGEYADDTAAGSGGVSSGALYYNTTSNDYRLKS